MALESIISDHVEFFNRYLADRGILPDTVAANGIRLSSPDETAKALGDFLPAVCWDYGGGYQRYRFLGDQSTFPLNDDGDPIKTKARKGSGNRVYFPLRPGQSSATLEAMKRDPSVPLMIVEGEADTLGVLQAEPGSLVVGISGNYGWKSKQDPILPALKDLALPGREVILCPDSDWWAKSTVKAGWRRVGDVLNQLGSLVKVAVIPQSEEKFGAGDYIHHKGAGAWAELERIPFRTWAKLKAVKPIKGYPEQINFTKGDDTGDAGIQTAASSDDVPNALRDYKTLQLFFNGRLRYNLLTKMCEFNGAVFEPADAKLNLAIDHGLKLKCTDEAVARICDRIAKESQYSPVQQYLEAVWERYGRDPQAKEAFHSLASTYFGTEDPIHQLQLEKGVISAVARAYEPGCKVDSMNISPGAQGLGKSTFIRTLASPEWFDDSLDLDTLGDKDSRLQLHSAWIIEFQEAETLFSTKRQRGTLKAFLTTRCDRLRRPYGRSFEVLERHFVIWGTTNHSQFLDDPTGNRRFWPIPVTKQIPIERLEANRDLIWAGAVDAYKSGASWWLTPAEAALAAEQTRLYEAQDPWHDAVAGFVVSHPQITIGLIFTELLQVELCKQTTHEQKRVAAILTGLGWTRSASPISFEGKKQRVWNAPQLEVATHA